MKIKKETSDCFTSSFTSTIKPARILSKGDQDYRELVENLGVIIYAVDINNNAMYINPAVASLLGFKPSEIINRSLIDIVHPDDQLSAKKHFKSIFSGEKKHCEYRIRCKSGAIKWLRINSQPIFSGTSIIGARGTMIDISDRKEVEEELNLKDIAIESSYQKLERVCEETVEALSSILGQRDPFTQNHQRNVTKLACAIATELNLSDKTIKGIHLAGLLHDIGKISIPAEILSKPSKLTDAEYRLVKTHAQIAYDILIKIDFPWPIAQIVLQHHERLDGSGYPQGLHGNEILQEAKILTVADVVEAMSSHRPYRPAPGVSRALEEIIKNSNKKYDPDSVNICLRLFNDKKFSF